MSETGRGVKGEWVRCLRSSGCCLMVTGIADYGRYDGGED